MVFTKNKNSLLLTVIGLFTAVFGSVAAFAEGEAGIISLRGQGHFFVGGETYEVAGNPNAGPFGAPGLAMQNQMFVGYQLPAEKEHPYPLVLVHGGGGQATDWFSTPDGRDGWRDYFLAAGFDVYWIDRPGYGRSPTHASYGELGGSASSGLISFLATADHWPGDLSDTDQNLLNWLASSPPGPAASNDIAGTDLSLLLERIGPSIVITHSAGGPTGWLANEANSENVAGIIAIEAAGSNMLDEGTRESMSFSPALSANFASVSDADGCAMQSQGSVSQLTNLAGKAVAMVGSERGLTQVLNMECGTKVLRQAGVDASFIYLPDLGLNGNGHFMMAETNSHEVVEVIIELAEEME
ncbi:MAG: alpha/beta fold hydrolase [Gammaproteobacteria bacterium]|jgi:pimeloyl-ACP methyl ester carboxylesterase|nr:alpha/beta fold hydrolase [Gammaproteobacteria bacterium]